MACIFLPIREKKEIKNWGPGGVTGGELHKESVIQIQCKLNCGILFEPPVYFKKRRHFIFRLSTLIRCTNTGTVRP